MASLKTIKSLDISSVTVMVTAISIVFSIILSIVLMIAMGITSINFIGPIALLIPSIICGTLIVTVYKTFIETFLYNLISSRTSISFTLEENGEISKISTNTTALIIAIVTTVLLIIEYLVGMIIIPLILGSTIETLMISGQSNIAYLLYQIVMLITNPSTMATGIIGGFVITFIYTLIGTYVYNLIADYNKRIKVRITDNSTLDSIDVKSFAIIMAVIFLVLGLITGLISTITTGHYLDIIVLMVVGFVVGFIFSAVLAVVYNKLAPIIGKIKFNLIDG